MVNFVIDNLLSSTKNRVFYETLWSLVIHKKRVQQQKYHTICLTQICNDLLEELNNDEHYQLEHKNRFYFTSQLAFGAVQVYKFQIDKLFNQVKNALATCTSKAFEFDWLNSSQSNSEASVKIRKIKEKDVLWECRALEFLDEEVFKVPQPAKKIQKIQPIDPTIVESSRTITLLDNYHPTQSTAEGNDDDFGVMTVEEFESFADLDQSQDSDRTAILEEVQTQDSDRTAILETVQSQDSDRTAILEEVQSQDSDRTTIWEISKFNKRKYCEDFDDDAPRNCSQTKRSKPCDISQDYIFNEDQTFHDVSLFDSGTNQLNIIDDHTLEINPPVLENTENIDLNATQPSIVVEDMILPEVDQLQIPKRKRKQRKTHPVFDERRKMPILNDNSTSFDQYQKHHIEDLPRVNFDQMIYKHKFGVDVLFQTASRTNMSQNLIFLVKRNLKKIPQSVLDRKNTKKAITQETTPISKPTTRSNQAAKKCPGDKNNNTTLEFELPELEDEILKTARMSLFMVDDEIVIDEPVAKLKPRRNNTVVDEYDEDKRWSQEMIMERLEVLWNNGEQQINMQILCGRLNRFVCAGIFFELLNLSKIGLITLEKQSGRLRIHHIQRNEF